MQRYRVLQTYVPPLIADWILEQSNLRETSVSVVIRDHLVAAWNRDNDHADRPGGPDPARQLVFLTTALEPALIPPSGSAGGTSGPVVVPPLSLIHI